MSDLIERIKSGTAFTTPDEIVKELEAQQAEIAEYKKQIKQMGSSVQHYEHLAMKFSSQADVYSHSRQKAWAEIARLREALEGIETKCLDCETINLIGKTCDAKIAGTLRSAINIARTALEQKP